MRLSNFYAKTVEKYKKNKQMRNLKYDLSKISVTWKSIKEFQRRKHILNRISS
jgi:hypothetical protein